ncbi:MAG: FeoB-associated Cys-rich membrane protein [Christensenellaceae bacterium]|jgi:hypothetical protein|nr:FeoB-associated Cys-rich membrane protein [Christensenellaceae bacterium]
MLSFLQANLPSLLVGAVVLALLALAIWSIIRTKKKTGSACGCGCSKCPYSNDCEQKE